MKVGTLTKWPPLSGLGWHDKDGGPWSVLPRNAYARLSRRSSF